MDCITFGESCPARGMGVEIVVVLVAVDSCNVMPREGHGSRNVNLKSKNNLPIGHAPRGAWE